MTPQQQDSAAGPHGATRIPVELGPRSYDILAGTGLFENSGVLVKPLLRRPHCVVVTDANVAPLYLETVSESLTAAGITARALIVPAGEGSKSFTQLEGLLDGMLASGLDRKSMVLALGGGVIGDLAGFAAAVALRGVDFAQLPTTLLAQTDSAVGGKTGVNLAAGKNLAGAFHQPRLVLADTGALASLPRRELLAGYAEVVKYGALGDSAFFDWLEENGPRALAGDSAPLAHMVAASCRAKAAVVAADEREAGRRALLNLGHTFGHALESAAGYDGRLLHGEAVAIGMVTAFDMSVRLGMCPAADAARLRRHLAAAGLPVRPADVPGIGWGGAADWEKRMQVDKKNADGKLVLVLARGLGRAELVTAPPRSVLQATLKEALAP